MLKLHEIPMLNNSLCFFFNPPCVNPKPNHNPNPNPKPFFRMTCCRSSASASHGHGDGDGSGSNFYKLLSLSSKNAGIQEIKRAYRTLALKYHPDVCDDEDATKMFVLLHTAYTTLVDPVLRDDYDCTLAVSGCRDQAGGHVCIGHRRWEIQIMQLKKRSNSSTSNGKEGSWGSRMRNLNKHTT